jgi:hypothetical protein
MAETIETSKTKSRIMYIELKSGPEGNNDRGAAWIGRVRFSKTGRTLYYRGKRLRSSKGYASRHPYANYFDLDTQEDYWVSGCKKNGEDRHWAGSGKVLVDEDVREEYWTKIRKQPEKKHLAWV